ncbi:hypothetical protein [uncultured Chryseobacterium sp.]|uniref:hypothetical protein n=1 Tax=uncultured Chryseobacterium sp. TaxID=259322 RepID=UPI0025902667|nr:hypothetical protein [uncultured Chryseobacterium sp.]
MKKLLFVAAFGVAGLVSAKVTEVKEVKSEASEKTEAKVFYNPIKITSSCGYTEYIDLGGSSMSCIEVEIDRMEEECDSPFEGWGYA